jgi:hypothetical protein
MLLAAVFGYILIQYRQQNINRLWLLPLLMMLWVNLHGGFAIGFILLVITFGSEVLKWLANISHADNRNRVLWLGAAGLLCAAAVMVNPYGPQMLAYPFRTVSIGALQNFIQEWQPPNFHEREAQVFIVLWLVTLGAVSYSGRRLDLTDFFLFATFTALALVARRNIAVFAVVAAPILMTHADAALAALQIRWPRLKLDNTPRPLRPPTLVLNWALLLLVLAASLLKISLPLSPNTVQTAIAATAPVGAANYLKAHPVPGRLFNSYNYGGYLIWALYPNMLVFMDGRTDLYDDAFLNEALNVFFTGSGWQALFARYNISAVLVEAKAPLATILLKQPDWAIRYRDHNSVVIVKLNE